MTGWKYVHGEGDDPLGAPTYVAFAHGVKFDPPMPQSEMARMIGTLGTAVRHYVEAMIKANDGLKKATPEDPRLKALAGKLMEQILMQHQNETGETFVIRSGASQTAQKPKQEPLGQHKALVKKYNADVGALNEDDLNRGLLVQSCENYVLELNAKVDSRIQIRATLRDLLERASKDLSFMKDSLPEVLLPTLVSDGWVLFTHNEEVRLLPYGKGVPSYDASKASLDHPAWSRSLDNVWEV